MGVERIVYEYPQHEHLLLWASHSDSPTPTSSYLSQHFSATWFWRGGMAHKYLQLLKLIRSLDIDVIHLHSSIAGVLGRLIPSKIPQMYSPHCFAFQRNDITQLIQKIYLAAEYLLSKRKCTLALCWPIEIQLAEQYFQKSRITFMPIVDLKALESAEVKPKKDNLRIAIIGRIRPQKDPHYLTEAVKHNAELKYRIIWIGSGDSNLITHLKESNIEVIPWMQQEDIWKSNMQIVATCIPSSWESGPLTLFESLSAGYPVICRSIPSLTLYGFQTFDSPAQLGDAFF